MKANPRPYLCTVCKKHDVKEGGYHANVQHIYKMITLVAVMPGCCDEEQFEHHICGRACYIQLLNSETDNMITATPIVQFHREANYEVA